MKKLFYIFGLAAAAVCLALPQEPVDPLEQRYLCAFQLMLGRASSEWDSPLALANGFDNYLMAVTEEEVPQLYLAIVPYLALSAHRSAEQAIIDTTHREIRWYLGAGEFERRASRGANSLGQPSINVQYVRGNETSGWLYEQGTPAKIRNSIATVARLMRKLRPDLIADNFEEIPFAKDSEWIHLDKRLNDPIQGPGAYLKNVRHDANNDLQVLLLNLPIAKMCVQMGGPQAQSMLDETMGRLGRNTQGLEAFLHLFEIDGQASMRVRVVRRWLERLRRMEPLSAREYGSLHFHLTALHRGIIEPAVHVLHLGKYQE